MSGEWMPGLRFNLSWEEFHQLPRNPGFKYEYLDKIAYLTPRPKYFHGRLDLAAPNPIYEENLSKETSVRQVQDSDQHDLVELFAGAFNLIQPFGSLSDEKRLEAARACLDKTFTGGDGPLIHQASFVAIYQASQQPTGAIFITLLPEGDANDWDSFYWRGPPPADCIERRLGRPHLTWIFVAPLIRGEGLGSYLLGAAVQALQQMGFKELLTTFLLGNDATLLWHWRNGFKLLPFLGSKRLWRKLIR